MVNYSKWISLAAFALLCISCFLPWSYHADVDKHFTGFFSEKNIYGKPAKMLLSLGGISLVCAFIHLLWLKRLALLASGLTVAYAIKNFLLFGSCYLGYCPEKEIGLYLMLLSSLLLFVMAFLPEGYDKEPKSA
ncbi:MAG: hypothetical protein ACK43J_01585 [Chitinophagaceae bacterium]|jgi:hypothetical protein